MQSYSQLHCILLTSILLFLLLGSSGGICEKSKLYSDGKRKSLNTGIITVQNYASHVPPKVSHITFAHEVGHNFGSPVRSWILKSLKSSIFNAELIKPLYSNLLFVDPVDRLIPKQQCFFLYISFYQASNLTCCCQFCAFFILFADTNTTS